MFNLRNEYKDDIVSKTRLMKVDFFGGGVLVIYRDTGDFLVVVIVCK